MKSSARAVVPKALEHILGSPWRKPSGPAYTPARVRLSPPASALDIGVESVSSALKSPPSEISSSRAARSPRSPATSPTPTAPRLRGLRLGRGRHALRTNPLRTRTRSRPATRGRSRSPRRGFASSPGRRRVAQVAGFRDLDVKVPDRVPLVPERAHLRQSLSVASAPSTALNGGVPLNLRVGVTPAASNPAFQASRHLRTTSTFSCDIARPVSPQRPESESPAPCGAFASSGCSPPLSGPSRLADAPPPRPGRVRAGLVSCDTPFGPVAGHKRGHLRAPFVVRRPCLTSGSVEAADGIRTHDLLHGKQRRGGGRGVDYKSPANKRVQSAWTATSRVCWSFTLRWQGIRF